MKKKIEKNNKKKKLKEIIRKKNEIKIENYEHKNKIKAKKQKLKNKTNLSFSCHLSKLIRFQKQILKNDLIHFIALFV